MMKILTIVGLCMVLLAFVHPATASETRIDCKLTNLEVHINLWHGSIVGDFSIELSNRGNTDVCITLGGKEITVPGNETKKYRVHFEFNILTKNISYSLRK